MPRGDDFGHDCQGQLFGGECSNIQAIGGVDER
jgi:hypothetical protein